MTKYGKTSFGFFIVILALGCLPLRAQEAQPATPAVHEIAMSCKKYEFSPDTIHVKKGEAVKLVITCTDRDHGIKLDAFHIDQRLKKGVATPVEFTPDRAGTFTFKCSVVCGMGHRGMKGKLVVEE